MNTKETTMNDAEIISEKRHLEDLQAQLVEAYRQGMPVNEELEAQIEADWAAVDAQENRR